MTEEQYRRIRSAIKADAVDRAHANLDEMVTTEDGFDDLLETMLRAEADIWALDAAHELAQQQAQSIEDAEEDLEGWRMRRMVEMADDVSLIAAQLDADAGTAFKATEPPVDEEADGTND